VNKNKSTFILSEEELKKQQKELLIEMNKLDNEMRKARKKKIIVITLIILIIITVIKIFFGTIQLYNVFGAPPSKARYYNVTVNNKQVAVSYISTKKIPIIPFLVNFNSVYMGNSYIKGDDTGKFFYNDGSDKYIIDINSYSCYYENFQTECTNNEQNMKQNTDTKYTNLSITRTTNPYKKIYTGEYIDNVTSYIREKGQYHIEITAKHGLIETKIHFYIVRR
jgi:hypothetical protein